jgi:LysR family transcriptional regulator, cyn operon transcriptional activator
MELRHLRYFEHVARLLSFTRAAQELNISQPNLSLQVQQLEDELGTALFERSGRQVQMTQAGLAFLPHAQQALAEVEAGTDAVAEITGLVRGTLRLGVTHSFGARLVPSLLAKFAQQHPHVHVVMTRETTRWVMQRLEDRSLDLVVGYQPVNNAAAKWQLLFATELAVVVSRKSRLAARKTISLEEIAGLRLVLPSAAYSTRALLEKTCEEQRVPLHVTMEIDDIYSILAVVKTGAAETILARTSVAEDKDLAVIPLRNPEIPIQAGMFWRNSGQSAASAAFGKLLAEECRSPTKSQFA